MSLQSSGQRLYYCINQMTRLEAPSISFVDGLLRLTKIAKVSRCEISPSPERSKTPAY